MSCARLDKNRAVAVYFAHAYRAMHSTLLVRRAHRITYSHCHFGIGADQRESCWTGAGDGRRECARFQSPALRRGEAREQGGPRRLGETVVDRASKETK